MTQRPGRRPMEEVRNGEVTWQWPACEKDAGHPCSSGITAEVGPVNRHSVSHEAASRSLTLRMTGMGSPFHKSAASNLTRHIGPVFRFPWITVGTAVSSPGSAGRRRTQASEVSFFSVGADSSHATCVRRVNPVRMLARPRISLNITTRSAIWPMRTASQCRVRIPIHPRTHSLVQHNWHFASTPTRPTLPHCTITTAAHPRFSASLPTPQSTWPT